MTEKTDSARKVRPSFLSPSMLSLSLCLLLILGVFLFIALFGANTPDHLILVMLAVIPPIAYIWAYSYQTERRRAAEQNRIETELKRHRDRLKEEVRERTGELLRINSRLEGEIQERERAYKALWEQEARYRGLFENMTEGIAVFRAAKGGEDFVFVEFNRAAETISAISRTEVVGKSVLQLFPGVKEMGLFDALHRVWRTGRPEHLPVSHYSDGRITRWLENAVYKLPSGEIVVVYRDESERKQAEAQLLLSDGIFNHTIEGIAITDADGTIERVNPAFTQITGYAAEEAIGKNPRILKSDRHDADFYRKMWQTLKDTGQWQGEIWNRRKSGEAYPEWLAVTAVADSRGETEKYVSVFHDISEIKRNRKMLRFQTYHDALTGLPNRHLFNDRLERAIAYAKRKNGRIAVLLVDLDNFKHINDSLGHSAGDEFLKKTAERLKRHCREEDTVARLGGDEFIILNSDLSSDRDAVEVANRIQRAFDEPIIIDHYELYTTTSIGITLFPEDGKDAPTLVKNADMAMYRAKSQGKNAHALFTPALHSAAARRMELENSLRKAIRLEEFTLFYQPKVNLATDRIVGVEALVRWFRPDGGMAPPDEFIPLAEETGMIHPLGEWVLKTACRQARIWNDRIRADLTVAVNLSARQFQDRDLIPLVRSILEETALDPSRLDLEITENMVMNHLDAAVEAMERLKAMGIHLSIDDFGTGYSSLSYLKRFPITLLKIDKSFVRDLPSNAGDAAIVRAILSLAHNLGLRVVAEGVETVEQLDFMRRHGCDEIQGYLFSKPLPAREMTRLLAAKGETAGLM